MYRFDCTGINYRVQVRTEWAHGPLDFQIELSFVFKVTLLLSSHVGDESLFLEGCLQYLLCNA